MDGSAIVAPRLQVIENADATGDKALRKAKVRQRAYRGVNCPTVLRGNEIWIEQMVMRSTSDKHSNIAYLDNRTGLINGLGGSEVRTSGTEAQRL